MRLTTATILAVCSGIATAHFQLLYPPPRGEFVDEKEPDFCGGYTNAGNRTKFPLTGGFFSIKSGHSWTGGVIISTKANPTSFDDFSVNGQQQFVSPFAKEDEGGTFCVPLNLTGKGVDVQNGSNVTIQIVLGGTDGQLYQCADLTLSSDFTIPESTFKCANATSDDHDHDDGSHDHSSASPSASASASGASSAASGTPPNSNGAMDIRGGGLVLGISVIALISVVL